MPLLYGEGERSFIRLQEEIMKISDDQSLFAWKFKDSTCQPYTGLLARHPMYFENSGNIFSLGLLNKSEPSSLTSKGLRAKFFTRPSEKEKGLYYALLECRVNTPLAYPTTETFIGTSRQLDYKPTIILQLVSVFNYGRQYVRVQGSTSPMSDSTLSSPGQNRTVYVRQDLFQHLPPSRFPSYVSEPDCNDLFWIRGTTDFQFTEPSSSDKWNHQAGLFSLPPSQTGRVLVIHCAKKDRKMSLLYRRLVNGSVCLLADPRIVISHSDSHNISSFDTVSQFVLWKAKLRKHSEVVATARISECKDFPRLLTVISLCLKTIAQSDFWID
jgi:hypothetical protein